MKAHNLVPRSHSGYEIRKLIEKCTERRLFQATIFKMPTYRDSINRQDKGFGRTKQYIETGKSAGKEQFALSAKDVTCNRMENLP